MPGDIILNLLKIKMRRRILKVYREKHLAFRGEKQSKWSRFLIRSHWSQKEVAQLFRILKEKSFQSKILHSVKISFMTEREIKTYLYKRKTFIISRTTTKEELNEVFSLNKTRMTKWGNLKHQGIKGMW